MAMSASTTHGGGRDEHHRCADHELSQTTIEQVAQLDQGGGSGGLLVDLTLENCSWRRVQTDPISPAFRYNTETGRIGLLDFGMRASTPITGPTALAIVLAGATAWMRCAVALGYLESDSPASVQQAIAGLILMASEPCRAEHGFDFGRTNLSDRLARALFQLRSEHDYGFRWMCSSCIANWGVCTCFAPGWVPVLMSAS